MLGDWVVLLNRVNTKVAWYLVTHGHKQVQARI